MIRGIEANEEELRLLQIRLGDATCLPTAGTITVADWKLDEYQRSFKRDILFDRSKFKSRVGSRTNLPN